MEVVMDYKAVHTMYQMDVFPDFSTRETAPLSVRGDAHHSWTIYAVNIDGTMKVVGRSERSATAEPVMVEDTLQRYPALMVVLHCHGEDFEDYFERATLYASPLEWYKEVCSQH